MTDQDAQNLTQVANNLGGRLIGSLPAQFLMLCILNLLFIAGLLWFMDRRELQRERVLAPYLQSCEKQVPADVLMQMFDHLRAK